MPEPKTADIDLIQRILPHRYPFLLVDRVEGIDGEGNAVGIKCVTMNEPYFQGHFPGEPVMPGVAMVESMAQTAAVMVGVQMDLAEKGVRVYFMGIESAKFRRKVGPGDVLRMHITTKRGGGRVWKFEGRAMVGDDLACEASFTAVMEKPA